MTISAQVIDTIVRWIDDNPAINRCVLMISLAMPGIRNGICNGCFYSTRGEPGRYIRERKLLLAARDLRDTDQRVYDITSSMALIRNRPLPASLPGPSNQPPGAYRKRTTVAR